LVLEETNSMAQVSCQPPPSHNIVEKQKEKEVSAKEVTDME
jgi:hypothetical protein